MRKNSASGRAVMHWFDAGSRGLALGLRQAIVDLGKLGLVLSRLADYIEQRNALKQKIVVPAFVTNAHVLLHTCRPTCDACGTL